VPVSWANAFALIKITITKNILFIIFILMCLDLRRNVKTSRIRNAKLENQIY
jgi:hypothetical protein